MVFGVVELQFLVLLFNMICLFCLVGDVGVVGSVVVGVIGVLVVFGGCIIGYFLVWLALLVVLDSLSGLLVQQLQHQEYKQPATKHTNNKSNNNTTTNNNAHNTHHTTPATAPIPATTQTTITSTSGRPSTIPHVQTTPPKTNCSNYINKPTTPAMPTRQTTANSTWL